MFLRRPLQPAEAPPGLRAWNPFTGAPEEFPATVLTDHDDTKQLGVHRGPRASTARYCTKVQEKLNFGLTLLSSAHLSWDEIGPAARAFLGGAANYAPLDSELPLEWLHQFDVRLGELPRRALHLGRPSRCQYYLPPHQGGLDLPCAVLEFGLIPWTRELLVELNDPT